MTPPTQKIPIKSTRQMVDHITIVHRPTAKAPSPRPISPASQPPLVDSGSVITSMKDLEALKDDPRYREAFALSQSQVQTMKQAKPEARDRDWNVYVNAKMSVLRDLASKCATSPAESEAVMKVFMILAGRVSQNFYNEPRFVQFVSTCYNIHLINGADQRLKVATFNALSQIISNPNFEPTMIAKLEEMTNVPEDLLEEDGKVMTKSGAALIGEMRHFHSHLSKKKEITKRTYIELIELAEILRYMDKELKDFAASEAEHPVDRFEAAARIRGKLSHLMTSAIPDVINRL